MRQAQSTTLSWRMILLLVAGIVTIVIIALLLAQIDTYQRQSTLPSNSLPLIDIDATVAAGELTVVYLPSEVSPTPTLLATPAQKTQVYKSNPLAAECDTPHNWIPYIVGPGDTLPKLARAHGTSVYHLMKANCIESTNLMAGRKIFLPAIPPTLAKPSGDDSHQTP